MIEQKGFATVGRSKEPFARAVIKPTDPQSKLTGSAVRVLSRADCHESFHKPSAVSMPFFAEGENDPTAERTPDIVMTCARETPVYQGKLAASFVEDAGLIDILVREIQGCGEIAHRRLAVIPQRLITGNQTGENRQVIACGNEAQDRRRVVLRMIDSTHFRVG